MHISVADAHGRLSYLVGELKKGSVTITRRGKPVGVLMTPEEYQQLSKLRAYLEMLRLSQELSESGVTANEVWEASRAELEARV
jgi:prevent-host-death family protein